MEHKYRKDDGEKRERVYDTLHPLDTGLRMVGATPKNFPHIELGPEDFPKFEEQK